MAIPVKRWFTRALILGALPPRKGDVVQAGDVLLRLDDAEARASRDLARREVEVSEARRMDPVTALRTG